MLLYRQWERCQMDAIWQELIKYLGSAVILTGALACLAKGLTKHILSKDLATYKAQLEATAKEELERLKGQLQVAAKEHEIRFGKLHEKRAEAVMELHQFLGRIHRLNLL